MSSVLPATLLDDLRSRGIEANAARWIVKALHPAGDSPPEAIPDAIVASTLFPEYREQAVVTCPAGVTTDTWDLMIIKPPGNVLGARWVAGDAGSDFRNVGPVLATGGSGNVYMQAVGIDTPASAMSGITFGASITPAVDTHFETVWPTANPVVWRKAASSITAYLTASAVADQGTVYASQLPREYIDFGNQMANIGAAGGVGQLYHAHLVQLPLNEDDMVAVDPLVYVAQAREGVYLPLRPFGDLAWRPPVLAGTGPVSGAGQTFNPDAILSLYFPDGPASYNNGPQSRVATFPFVLGQPPITTPPYLNAFFGEPRVAPSSVLWGGPVDSNFDHWNTGIILFRGLAKDASVTLRIVDVVEQVPDSGSVFRPFVAPPSQYDPRAIETFYRVAESMAAAYPSSFNNLGLILNGIRAAATMLAPHILPIAARGVAALAQRVLGGRSKPPPPVPRVLPPPSMAGGSTAAVSRARQLATAPARVSYRAPPGPTGRSKPLARKRRR